ncbi:septum site-determining protein Ssd [Aquipuribacter hungaricus]|uniref:Septum site-determining protein Ssd n=1 Tax=Aquipuribacter hungaricus TaxID=545624 RepID=A0ABV7WIB7_9MICO
MAEQTEGRRPAGRTARAGSVLCLVSDPDLRARLLTACRDVAVTPDVRAGVPTAGLWCAASLVLLDAATASRVGGLPRRAGVVLVQPDAGGGEPDEQAWRLAVAAGAEHVVVLPDGAGWLAEALVRAVRPRGRCVGVVGARGGAGSTATAVALATAAAASGRRVLLVDADPLGGGLDLAMGAEELPGVRWHDLHDVRAPLPAGGLAVALPVADEVAVLSYGRGQAVVLPGAARAVVRAGLDEHDLVVLDLPRAGDEAALAASGEADVLLCVCPSELRAAAAAPAVLRRWGAVAEHHLLVRGPAPGGLREADTATAVRAGLDLLATGGPAPSVLARVDVVRAEPGLAAAMERGEAFGVAARSPLRRWARRWVADELPGGLLGGA